MSSQFSVLSDHLLHNKNGRDIAIRLFLVPSNWSCLDVSGFTQKTICFKIVIFHDLTNCVLFDYVINDEIIKIFQSEISLSSQIVYSPVIVTIMKLPQVFMNFFLLSQVTINIEIMENLAKVKQLYVIVKKKTKKILYSET